MRLQLDQIEGIFKSNNDYSEIVACLLNLTDKYTALSAVLNFKLDFSHNKNTLIKVDQTLTSLQGLIPK